MTPRLAFVLCAAALLSGCSTMSGPEGLFGYPAPQPGVLAGEPGLVTGSTSVKSTSAVQPLPPAPARAALRPLVPAAASVKAETAEDGERERMVAAALAPVSAHQSLGELALNANGTMVLPAARSLEIIDIAPIRKSMADELPEKL